MKTDGLWVYVWLMTKTVLHKELKRIDQELNAEADPPSEGSHPAKVNRKQPPSMI